MTPQESLVEMAIALNYGGLDDNTQTLYIREIAHFDSRDVTAACQRLSRTSQWWPKLFELRTAIQEESAKRERITRGADDPERTFRCGKCFDGGWIIVDCSGPPQRECGRQFKGINRPSEDGKRLYHEGSCHAPHTYAVRCTCGVR